ncbi:MAG: hypothetical protein CMF31_09090 [Kordiimonas sp.]|nr:hypothetical protein [Kordiimonas sp.]|tara:strand:- start:1183 stop:1437 length:255 start_codon:yes stop_codon:yes gene_type:complete
MDQFVIRTIFKRMSMDNIMGCWRLDIAHEFLPSLHLFMWSILATRFYCCNHGDSIEFSELGQGYGMFHYYRLLDHAQMRRIAFA